MNAREGAAINIIHTVTRGADWLLEERWALCADQSGLKGVPGASLTVCRACCQNTSNTTELLHIAVTMIFLCTEKTLAESIIECEPETDNLKQLKINEKARFIWYWITASVTIMLICLTSVEQRWNSLTNNTLTWLYLWVKNCVLYIMFTYLNTTKNISARWPTALHCIFQ